MEIVIVTLSRCNGAGECTARLQIMFEGIPTETAILEAFRQEADNCLAKLGTTISADERYICRELKKSNEALLKQLQRMLQQALPSYNQTLVSSLYASYHDGPYWLTLNKTNSYPAKYRDHV